jgi:glycosyltransferase involved in cell wall biosynthesis
VNSTGRRVVHLAAGSEWRGGERQVFLLARELRARSVDQLVITGAGGPLAARLADAGIPHRGVAWSRGPSATALWAALSEARRAPVVFHAHDPHAVIVAGLAALLHRPARFVATRRVVFPLRRPGFWARADRVLAISEAVRAVLLAVGIRSDRTTIVPSGIDLEETRRARPDRVRDRLGLPIDAPLVVAVGALTDDKDPASLVHTAAILRERAPEAHWAVAGSGPLRGQLETMIRRDGLGPSFHLLGQLDDPRPLIASGDVFDSTSAAEGLGTSLLDAMALGRPIVATRVGGIPELLGRGAGVLVEPRDPGALAAAVERLLRDPAEAAAAGRRAEAEAQDWSAGRMADAVLAVYRSLALDR